MFMRNVLILILLFASYYSEAQKLNDIWYFGNDAGLSFSSSTPTVLAPKFYANEGVATVSDRHTGELLFYTDGVDVFDTSNNIMPNGNGIGTDNIQTSAQGVIIIPNPNDSNKYYIVTLQNQSQPGEVYYSIVDMGLNSGKGDVIVSSKKILLAQNIAEGMACTYACDGQWIVLRERNSDKFLSYKVNINGIDNTPVVSNVVLPNKSNGIGSIKISHNGKLLVVVANDIRPTHMKGCLVLSDFDPKTGIISNPKVLDSYSISNLYVKYARCEYSPNNTKLYVTSETDTSIYQYDLAKPTITGVVNSKSVVYKNSGSFAGYPEGIQLAPDSNIYVSFFNRNFLSRISNTNSAYPGCLYTHTAVNMPSGSLAYVDLPQFVLEKSYAVAPLNSLIDVAICTDSQSKTLKGRKYAEVFEWSNGAFDSTLEVVGRGVYWVKSGVNETCHTAVDTYNLFIPDIYFDLGNDTAICYDDKILLSAEVNETSVSYAWSDNSKNETLLVNKAGRYIVTVSSFGCSKSDTINIDVKDNYIFDLGNDTSICKGDIIQLSVQEGLDNYVWNTGVTNSSIQVSNEGYYSLSVNDKGCSYNDSIVIIVVDPNVDIGNDTIICLGEEITLSSSSLKGAQYFWSNGSVQDSIIVQYSGVYTVRVENKCGTYYDTINVENKNCECKPFIPSAFSPNRDGLNDFFKVILSCPISNYQLIIANRYGQIVFESANPNEYWNGMNNNRFCDVGTYYYVLKIKDEKNANTNVFKGDLLLLK